MKKAVCGILAYEKSSMQYSSFYTWKSRLCNKIEEENMNTEKKNPNPTQFKKTKPNIVIFKVHNTYVKKKF